MSVFQNKSIVVPWDFSEMSKGALGKALEMTGDLSKIEVVYVAQTPSAAEPGIMFGDYSEEEIAKHVLEEYQKEADSKFKDASFTTLFGDPGTEITQFAEDKDAGAIVISSHGRTGLSRLFMGSVAERVVRLATCPVVVLKD